MSRIRFHSISGTAEIKGHERHVMGATLECAGLSVLGRGGFHQIEPLTRGVQFAGRDDESIRLAIRHGSGVSFVVGGKPISVLSLLLNTCVDIGNDVLRLLARIHGQCELHAFVLGEHRKWMADIIKHGRKWDIMRAGQGWEELVAFLGESNTETVVMSYSVCEGFPNGYVAKRGGWLPRSIYEDAIDEEFYKMSREEQFALALKGLDDGLRVGPDTIHHGFDTGASAFTLLAELAQVAKS